LILNRRGQILKCRFHSHTIRIALSEFERREGRRAAHARRRFRFGTGYIADRAIIANAKTIVAIENANIVPPPCNSLVHGRLQEGL
jgi:hypothetical protein